MSYRLEPTTFSFEEGSLGHRALAKLNELERKINYLVIKHTIDVAVPDAINAKLKKLLQKRESFFNRVLEHYMDKTARSIDEEKRRYLISITTLTALSVLSFLIYGKTDYVLLYSAVGTILFLSIQKFYVGYKALFLACEKHQSFVKFFSSITLSHIHERECSICYELMKEDELLIGHLALSRIPHVFHKACVPQDPNHLGLLKPTYKCPLCRAEVLYLPFKNKRL